ncbi:MAG: hypothetical protein KC656_26635, partial [Myxococcales bacterium]|nr:hypothetical protein [Myxococcales bacterium]
LRIDEDGRRIEADFGPPVNATVRLVAFDEPGCPFESHVCPEGCADFQPLTRIHLDLGTFYAVQDVRFY